MPLLTENIYAIVQYDRDIEQKPSSQLNRLLNHLRPAGQHQITRLIRHYALLSGSNDLDQLLRDVKQRQMLERKINRTREAEFLAEKKTQQQLLQTAEAKLATQQKLSAQYRVN
jgi:hypothetical protein